MTIFIQNITWSIKLSLNVFLLSGMWKPEGMSVFKIILYYFYFFLFYMCMTGIYIIIQAGDLLLIWGDISLMTANFFLLFTNVALSVKMFNIVLRGSEIKALVRDCDRELREETTEDGKVIIASYKKEAQRQLYVYIFLTYATILGWSLSAEKGQLPMRAWYPFDTTKSPAYQLTYVHQCLAVAIGAGVDVGTDTLVTSLVSQCRCRLRLLDLSLRTLCDGFQVEETGLIAPDAEEVIYLRLRRCVQRHQAVLNDAQLLQDCFSIATLSQFTVSIFIICVTAYQLAFESKTIIGVASMIFYLVTMMMQVFIYCYQGNQLVVESEAISAAAYECPWYSCRAPLRLALLVIMTRATRSFKLTAANLTELSLATFVSIIKASYTFFTVLQGVVDVS